MFHSVTSSSVHQVQTEQSPSGQQKNPLVLQGFQGCLDSVLVNANQLPLQNKRSHVAEVVELAEIKLGCVLHPDHCRGQRCLNGATCVNLPSGGNVKQCNSHRGSSLDTGPFKCVD